jgi:hypothetical protein
MARGFESKSVADQQESAQAEAPSRDKPIDPVRLARRKQLELSRADVKRRLDGARAEGHREMLRRALQALDDEIATLGTAR